TTSSSGSANCAICFRCSKCPTRSRSACARKTTRGFISSSTIRIHPCASSFTSPCMIFSPVQPSRATTTCRPTACWCSTNRFRRSDASCAGESWARPSPRRSRDRPRLEQSDRSEHHLPCPTHGPEQRHAFRHGGQQCLAQRNRALSSQGGPRPPSAQFRQRSHRADFLPGGIAPAFCGSRRHVSPVCLPFHLRRR